MKVLYVEDNPANARLIAKFLALEPGVVLYAAATAEEGVALARREIPDVVLMDLNLPRMSGHEACTVLRGDAATRAIPLVALSADAVPEHIRGALAAGFDAYLTKPVDLVRLREVLVRFAPRPA